uniref:Uncharacterized protein n=1 Tax=Romanomermis culicivorax TaxID=13658 RepID=A0A915ILW7_ROMCU
MFQSAPKIVPDLSIETSEPQAVEEIPQMTEGRLSPRPSMDARDQEPISQASELEEDEDMSESISDLPSISQRRGKRPPRKSSD